MNVHRIQRIHRLLPGNRSHNAGDSGTIWLIPLLVSCVVALSPPAFAKPVASLPSLPSATVGSATPSKFNAIPLSAQAGVSLAISRIAARYQVAVVSFVPLYSIDLTAFGSLGLGSSALDASDRLADILDGHIELIGKNLIVIEPNFRVDQSSAPLVPQVQAAVRAANGLATAFGLIPRTKRISAISPETYNISGMSPAAVSNLLTLTVNDSPISTVVFSGDTKSGVRSLSFRPELIVTVSYGAMPIGTFDAWEQQASSDKHWDVIHSLADGRAAFVQAPASPLAVQPFDYGSQVTVRGTRITLPDLAAQLGDSAHNLIVDARSAKWPLAMTRGIYDKRILLDAALRATRSRIESAGELTASPQDFVIAEPRAADDQRLVHAAVNRAIMDAWLPLIQTASSIGNVAPFTFNQFAGFSTIKYGDLTDRQRETVDQLFAQQSDTPTDEDKARLTLTLRPGVIVQGRSAVGTSVIEQIGVVYEDAEP